MTDNTPRMLARRDLASLRVTIEHADENTVRDIYRELKRLAKEMADKYGLDCPKIK